MNDDDYTTAQIIAIDDGAWEPAIQSWGEYVKETEAGYSLGRGGW